MTRKEIEAAKQTLPRTRNYKEWTESQKTLREELSCREMINSCLVYGGIEEFWEKCEWRIGYKSYAASYICVLGRERVQQLVKEQEEDFAKAKVLRDVFVDDEGLSYSSICWSDEEEKEVKQDESSDDYYSLDGVIDVIKAMGSNQRTTLDGYLGDVVLVITKDPDYDKYRNSVIMDMTGSEEMNLVTVDFRLNGKSIASTYDIHVSELESVLNDILKGDSKMLIDESRSLKEIVNDIEEPKWVLTDDDSQQYVKRTSKFEFDLIEMSLIRHDPDRFEVYSTNIDVAEWFDDDHRTDLEIIIGAYSYNSIDEMKKQYGEKYLQVIAECVFEYYGSLMADKLFEGSEEECEEYIKKFVGGDLIA